MDVNNLAPASPAPATADDSDDSQQSMDCSTETENDAEEFQSMKCSDSGNNGASADYEDFDVGNAEYKEYRRKVAESNPEKGRSYQVALCELAINENCIICLPTGCGKTYIALAVAKSEYLPKAIAQNKKIVFLANSVALVFQQAEYFKRHISSSSYGERASAVKGHVKVITGAMGTDRWRKEKWEKVMDSANIFVTVPDVLKMALDHNYVTLDQINLLILDECHNATKSDPMATIMDEYRDKQENYPDYKLPRVIGLTATIIKGTPQQDKIAEEVESIERRLCSRAVTYPEYTEVLEYSTNAHISIVPYKSLPQLSDTLKDTEHVILALLKETIKSITEKAKTLKDSREPTVETVSHPLLKTTTQMYNKNKISAQDILKALKNAQKIFESEKDTGLGLYAGRLGARQKLAFLQLINFDDQTVEHLKIEAEDALNKVVDSCQNILSQVDKAKQLEVYLSAKVHTLYNMLLAWNYTTGKKESLCGIVFCKERFTAQILSWMFLDASRNCKKFAFIKPAFVVGSSGGNMDLKEQNICAFKLDETIRKFREKEINLVFATDVLEEGLDVPTCNFVIRFDCILTYPSFVQSMGRARNKEALFSVMTTAKDCKDAMTKIRNYQSYGDALATYLSKSKERLVNGNDELLLKTDDDDTKFSLNPDDPNSPKITLTSSVQLVYQYCQYLSTDRIVSLEPTSWWNVAGVVDNKSMYKAFVALPINAIVRGVIEGKETNSKNGAKRYAFLKTCQELYREGALDENLFPIRRAIPKQIKSFLDDMDGDQLTRNGKKIGTKNSVKWYEKKIPESISNSEITAGETLMAFRMEILLYKSTTDSSERKNLYNFDKFCHKFAFLTKINLEDIPQINLYGRYGIFKCSFVRINLKECTVLAADKISKIEDFQKFIFSECLQINHPLMFMSEENNFLIAAIKKDINNEWTINWNLMEKVVATDCSLFTLKKTEEDQRKICYLEKELEDAVVIPWYRCDKTHFYCVCSITKDITPSSPINGATSSNGKSFDEHYSNPNYNLKILNRTTPFLRCAAIGSQLNFLTTKRNDNVLTKAAKKMNHDAAGLVDLVPEFLNIFPIPASLLIQAKFLPSIIHRIHRLLFSREIQLSVAKTFQWTAAMNWNENKSSEVKFHDDDDEGPSPPKKIKLANEEGERSTNDNETLAKKTFSTEKQNEGKADDISDIVHLDYIHPDEITDNDIENHRAWKVNRKLNTNQISKLEFLSKTVNPSSYILPLISSKEISFESLDAATDFGTIPGPFPEAIMEALTLSNANDVLSLENLEVIGDSFLKYCVSTHVFCEFCSCDEGNMTEMRNKLVSNFHLFKIGSQKQIGEYLAGGIFSPKCAWLPPGQKVPIIAGEAAAECNCTFEIFNLSKEKIESMSQNQLVSWIEKKESFKDESMESHKKSQTPENCTFTHSRLGDKSIADCVEALIGVYYMNGGQDAAFAFMDWMGFRPPDENGNPVKYHRRQPPKRAIHNPKGKTPEDYIPLLSELEKLIDYEFQDKWLLVEAFSHPGYLKNDVTRSYERLEFIGDAVLDFLVTNHIYKSGLRKTPGEFTDLRSALVNNVTFGSLAVRYKMHNYLLFICKKLQDAIDKFETYQMENGHAVTGHFTLLNDWECPIAMEIEVPKVLGDIFESLAGAVFLDSNMSLDRTWTIFYRLMKNEFDEFAKHTPLAPIRELYENFPNLKFHDVETKNSERKDMSHVAVKLNGKRYFGMGTNKKQAKQAAAKYALRCYGREFGLKE